MPYRTEGNAIDAPVRIMLITSPLWGALLLWTLLGISLVILGIVQIVRGFTFGSRRTV